MIHNVKDHWFVSKGLALKQCLVVQAVHHLVLTSVLNVQQRTLHG
jgi:hypothetical protein